MRKSTKRTGTRKAASGNSQRAPAKAKSRGFLRGDAGRANVETEQKKAAVRKEQREKAMNQPFRFRMKEGEEGREVVILDDAPDFYMYEHTLQDPQTGWWNVNLACCQVFDNCPVCEAGMASASYNMVLTALDLQEYTTKKKDVIPFSRKLFIVKSKQHRKFLRLYEKNGTLRGARFILARDTDKDPVIGSDIEFDGYMEEDELSEYVRDYEDREGKIHEEDCSVPYDYDEVFEEPDPELLRHAVPEAEPQAGSRAANAKEPMREKRRGGRREEEAEQSYEDDDGSESPFEDDADDERDDHDDGDGDDSDGVDSDDSDSEEDAAEEEEAPRARRKAGSRGRSDKTRVPRASSRRGRSR